MGDGKTGVKIPIYPNPTPVPTPGPTASATVSVTLEGSASQNAMMSGLKHILSEGFGDVCGTYFPSNYASCCSCPVPESPDGFYSVWDNSSANTQPPAVCVAGRKIGDAVPVECCKNAPSVR